MNEQLADNDGASVSLPADTEIFCAACGSKTEKRQIDGRKRPVCPACGQVVYLDPKLAVAVVLVHNGAILLGKRGPGARESGKWSFPAGFVERGERVEDAAVRETKEEAGVDVALSRLIGLFSSVCEPVVLAVYEASIVSGEPSAGDDITEVEWFPLVELPELAFPRDRHILEAWRDSRESCQGSGSS